MCKQDTCYRVFFWKFGLLVPLLSALLLGGLTLLFYGYFTGVALVFGAVVAVSILGLPASFLIAAVACRCQWTRNVRGCLSVAAATGVAALTYEVLVMAVTDGLTGEVGSFFHPEVLYLALWTALVGGLCAWRWLPQPKAS